MSTAKSLLGRKAERLAAIRLRQLGYRIVEANFRCRYGELDIVAWDGDTLAFVEVRSHATLDFGSPAESIGPRKRARLCLTAQAYLEQIEIPDPNCRFDVVEIVFAEGQEPSIELIKDAFQMPDIDIWN